jgi:hypothetical protein
VSIQPEFSMFAAIATPIPGVGCALCEQRDVILARADLPQLSTTNPQGHQYGEFATPGHPTEYIVPVTIPPNPTAPVPIHRGWASTDVSVQNKQFRFIDTQLEAYNKPIRGIQASLPVQQAIDTSPLPVVAVGDFNTLRGDNTYAYLTMATALTDAWPLVARDGDPGYTAGQDDSLRNIPSKLNHTVDYVFFQGGRVHADPRPELSSATRPPT